MMRIYLIIFALLLFAANAYSQYDYIPSIFPESVLAEINGGFSECIQSRHHFKTGDTNSFIRSQEDIFYYDSTGKIIRKLSKDPAENEINTFYFYYEHGKLAKKEKYIGSEDTQILKNLFEYKYDSQGELINFSEANKNGKKVKNYEFKTYYAANNLDSLQCFSTDSLEKSLVFAAKNSFDSAGRKTYEIIYNPAGAAVRKVEFKYTADGKQLEKNTFNLENKTSFARTYNYYDSGHRLISTSYKRDGTIQGVSISTFDKYGNLRQHTLYDAAMYPWARFAYSYLK